MSDFRDIPRVTREQYNLWRNSPVTLTVYRFLEAYRDQVRQEHLDRWEQGELEPQLETRALGVILFTESFLELNYDAIEAAYDGNFEC
jgi:hypothetical protein